MTCYNKKGTITTDLLPSSSLDASWTFQQCQQTQQSPHFSFSVSESIGVLSNVLTGHCRWPWARGALICSWFVLPNDTLSSDPCLVLNDLAHSLPWTFLSTKPPGYSCGSRSLQCQVILVFFFLFTFWLTPESYRLFRNPSTTRSVNATVNRRYPLWTTASIPSGMLWYFCLRERRMASGEENLWWQN